MTLRWKRSKEKQGGGGGQATVGQRAPSRQWKRWAHLAECLVMVGLKGSNQDGSWCLHKEVLPTWSHSNLSGRSSC